MNPILGSIHLWVLLVPLFLIVVAIMAAATRSRGAPILNREDHRPANIAAFGVNFAVFVAVTVFTPLRTGPWFWLGLSMLAPAALLYLLSIAAFITTRTGLTTGGIYARTRNPMYVALGLLVLAFSSMAMQASTGAALALLASSGIFLALVRARVAHEEHYLDTAYGEAWRAYRNATPRFLGARSFR